jgi:hypothetical protein
MLTGESNPTPFRDTPMGIAVKRQFDLAVREAVLNRVEHGTTLPRVPVEYFDPGHNANEDDWWSKQLGRRWG